MGVIYINYGKVLIFRNTLANWLNQYNWEMWCTGTFKPDQSYRDTIKTKNAFNRFVNDLTVNFNKPNIEYFLAVEFFKSGDFTHCHFLLNGVDGLTYKQVWETWFNRYGRAKVEGYKKELGANYYLTKYCVKSLCDWDLRINKINSHKLLDMSLEK